MALYRVHKKEYNFSGSVCVFLWGYTKKKKYFLQICTLIRAHTVHYISHHFPIISKYKDNIEI